jgi:hypothetical protein
MRICKFCGAIFKSKVKIDGIWRSIYKRKYCLECSPFGLNNRKTLEMSAQGRLAKLQTRFAKHVAILKSGCWAWTASTVPAGYGKIKVEGKWLLAHRVSWEFLYGKIPAGLQIDHLCRNPSCVNPAHMEVVTGRENVLRGSGPTAINHRKTLCMRGHPLSGDNLRQSKNGGRACMACDSARHRAKKNRQPELEPR